LDIISSMKQIITSIITILLLVSMSFFVYKAYHNAKSYEEISQIIVEKHNVSQLSTNQLKKFGKIISLGIYNGYDEVLDEENRLIETQEFFKKRATKYTIYSIGLASILSLAYFVLSIRLYTIIVSISALIALGGGLLIPIMTLTIHKEVEYLGDVVLSMESKGVLGSISKLFENSEFVVAITLLLFSIVIPIIKTLSMLFVALFIENRSMHIVVHFFKILGKWSMADVFVVSTFLVYLSGNRGEMSHAEVEMGLYLFLSYVVLSMIASLSADKMLRDHKEI